MMVEWEPAKVALAEEEDWAPITKMAAQKDETLDTKEMGAALEGREIVAMVQKKESRLAGRKERGARVARKQQDATATATVERKQSMGSTVEREQTTPKVGPQDRKVEGSLHLVAPALPALMRSLATVDQMRKW
jgi:hypothetical protein